MLVRLRERVYVNEPALEWVNSGGVFEARRIPEYPPRDPALVQVFRPADVSVGEESAVLFELHLQSA